MAKNDHNSVERSKWLVLVNFILFVFKILTVFIYQISLFMGLLLMMIIKAKKGEHERFKLNIHA